MGKRSAEAKARREARKTSRKAQRTADRIKKGECTKCPASDIKPARPGFRQCEDCAKKDRLKIKKRRERCIQAGICTSCQQRLSIAGPGVASMCGVCEEAHIIRRQNRRSAMLAASIPHCPSCLKPHENGETGKCAACRAQNANYEARKAASPIVTLSQHFRILPMASNTGKGIVRRHTA